MKHLHKHQLARLQKIAGIIKESRDFDDEGTKLTKDEVSQEDLKDLASDLERTHFIKDVQITSTSVSCMTEDDEVFMIYQYDEDSDSWLGAYEGQKRPEGGGNDCSPDEFLEAVEATADYRSEEDEYKKSKGID